MRLLVSSPKLRREAEAAAQQIQEAWDAIDISIDNQFAQIYDNIEKQNELLYKQGQIDELTYQITKTQIALVDAMNEYNGKLEELEQRRAAALDGITDPAQIQEINKRFDDEAGVLKQGFDLEQSTIIQGGVDSAAAVGISGDTFLSGLDDRNLEYNGAIYGSTEQFGEALRNYDNFSISAFQQSGQTTGAAAADSGAATAEGVDEGTSLTTQAVGNSTDQTTGALADRSATIASFLERGDVTPQLRSSLENFNAAIADGGNLSAQEIDAARDKVTSALNDRGEKIRALVNEGVPLADAIRQVDLEFARTVDETSAEISRSASEGGQKAAEGIGQGQDAQLKAIEALKSGLLTGIGGLSGQVTPQIADEHRKLMDAFIEGARTSGGGIDAAESVQIQAMQGYQSQLDSSVSGIGGNVAPGIAAAHSLIGGAFTQGGGTVQSSVSGALGLITGGVNTYSGVSHRS